MNKKNAVIICLVWTLVFISACSSGQPTATQPAPQPAVTNQPVEVKPTSTAPATAQPTALQPATSTTVSFSKDIFPIIQPFVNCHDNLSGYQALMPWVVAGQPENSKLWRRLNGQGGSAMPPDGPLPDAQLKLIYQWIKEGAQNN